MIVSLPRSEYPTTPPLLAQPSAPTNGQAKRQVPTFDSRYRVHHWWSGWRPIDESCPTCKARPVSANWLQRWIRGPQPPQSQMWFPRTVWFGLWLANLLPRGVSLWTALTGGRTSGEAYNERQATCSTCPDRVIHLRLLKATIYEKSYCGSCNCGAWWLARLDVKNRLRGWRCPKRRHGGSDPDACYRVYALGKAAEAQRAATAASGSAGGTSTGNGGRNASS